MAQGEFTIEETQCTCEAVDEIFSALPKTKQPQYLGHLNDILLYLAAAKKVAPTESKIPK